MQLGQFWTDFRNRCFNHVKDFQNELSWLGQSFPSDSCSDFARILISIWRAVIRLSAYDLKVHISSGLPNLGYLSIRWQLFHLRWAPWQYLPGPWLAHHQPWGKCSRTDEKLEDEPFDSSSATRRMLAYGILLNGNTWKCTLTESTVTNFTTTRRTVTSSFTNRNCVGSYSGA